MHSFRCVREHVCRRRVRRGVWILGNCCCALDPLGSDVHRYHRVGCSMAPRLDWGDPVHRSSCVLLGLGLGAIYLDQLLGDVRTAVLGRRSVLG